MRVIALLAATVMAGGLFIPVFSVASVLIPVGGVAAVVLVADLLAVRWPKVTPWRATAGFLLGLLVIAETTLGARGIPDGQTLTLFAEGITSGWLRTLESTWPARPDADLVLFVPLLALVAAVLSVETLRRTGPLWALLPSAALLVLSQMFVAADGKAAITWGLGYAIAAAVVLGATQRVRRNVLIPIGVSVLTIAAGGIALQGVDFTDRPAFSLQREHVPERLPSDVLNPLDEIAMRLSRPDQVAFTVRSQDAPALWTVAAFDEFDGVNWTTSGRYQPLGSALPPDPAVTWPVRRFAATVTVTSTPGPWLPAPQRLHAVQGADVLVDPGNGTMLATKPTDGLRYDIEWSTPDFTALTDDSLVTTRNLAVGQMPAGLADLAATAVANRRASLTGARALESWMRQNYTLASGKELPTGHSYPQLLHFLSGSKRGTSEQFAAAYVVLARAAGIPARLAVGFRQGKNTDAEGNRLVRNGDVLAWPEIPVAGVGWLPMDPTGTLSSDKAGPDVAAAQDKPQDVPSPGQQIDQGAQAGEGPPELTTPQEPTDGNWLLPLGLAMLAGLISLIITAVPAAKSLRRWRRRRGTPVEAVVGAWLDVRDRLRDNGVDVRRGMTVRELLAAAAPIFNAGLTRETRVLSECVDFSLWSGADVPPNVAIQAWSAADYVRQATTRLPLRSRLRALFGIRGLLPLRQ